MPQRVRYASDIVLRILLLLAFYAVNSIQADDKHTKLQKITLMPGDSYIYEIYFTLVVVTDVLGLCVC